MKKATLFQKLENNLVRCNACLWYCKIPAGSLGICATRVNKNGSLYSLVWGKAVGLHLDPVEKKPLYHFLPGSNLLSFGTLGCNFGCLFCQNWEMSQINKLKTTNSNKQKTEKQIISIIDEMSVDIAPKKIVEMAQKEGVAGIAYTYNEPAIFTEFAHDTAKLAKKKKLKNVYVSNGYESVETVNYIKDYIDAINIDLKSFREEFYRDICKAHVEPVKENIIRFFSEGIDTEVTTLIIPGENDSKKELGDIARFLVKISPDIPWHISSFRPSYKMMNTPSTPKEKLLEAYKIGKEAGLRYIYMGNISDWKHESTYCFHCKALLIYRDGYYLKVKDMDLAKGRCRKCMQKIYGIWN
jgi:pyruvate formate lyase activating enzyme